MSIPFKTEYVDPQNIQDLKNELSPSWYGPVTVIPDHVGSEILMAIDSYTKEVIAPLATDDDLPLTGNVTDKFEPDTMTTLMGVTSLNAKCSLATVGCPKPIVLSQSSATYVYDLEAEGEPLLYIEMECPGLEGTPYLSSRLADPSLVLEADNFFSVSGDTVRFYIDIFENDDVAAAKLNPTYTSITPSVMFWAQDTVHMYNTLVQTTGNVGTLLEDTAAAYQGVTNTLSTLFNLNVPTLATQKVQEALSAVTNIAFAAQDALFATADELQNITNVVSGFENLLESITSTDYAGTFTTDLNALYQVLYDAYSSTTGLPDKLVSQLMSVKDLIQNIKAIPIPDIPQYLTDNISTLVSTVAEAATAAIEASPIAAVVSAIDQVSFLTASLSDVFSAGGTDQGMVESTTAAVAATLEAVATLEAKVSVTKTMALQDGLDMVAAITRAPVSFIKSRADYYAEAVTDCTAWATDLSNKKLLTERLIEY